MRGILFKEEMFLQIVRENKTQTRRLSGLEYINQNPDKHAFAGMDFIKSKADKIPMYALFQDNVIPLLMAEARYRKGEILYLKEPYKLNKKGEVIYRFNYNDYLRSNDYQISTEATGWKNKLFMPEKYARCYILISNVRCERLNDIKPKDAIAEGISELLQSGVQLKTNGRLFRDYSKKKELFNDGLPPVQSFKSLWNSINKKNIWDTNPYVFVYCFKIIEN